MPGDAKLPRVRQVVGPADPIPFNLTVFKGGKSWQLPRRFVWFLLYHPVAKTFLGDWHSTISVGASLNLILSEWSKTMYVPDESIVPTLARITHYQVKILVGSWIISITLLLQNTGHGWIVTQDEEERFQSNHLQIWRHNRRNLTCRGSYRRNTCIMSLLDLSTCLQRDVMIGNKVLTARDPLMSVCVADGLKRRALSGQ